MSWTENTQAQSINEPSYSKLVTTRNKRPITSSRKIANLFDKNHKDVLRSIKNLECSSEFNERNFTLVKYQDSKGEMRPEYEMTRDGFFFVAFGFTGQKAAQFKEAYINRFNEMESKLQDREEKAVLNAKDLVRLIGDNAAFEDVVQDVPYIIDEQGRRCYHYLLSLERLGFSTRSGSVWKRARIHPAQFLQLDNADYVSQDFIHNMFMGKMKSHNDKVFKSPQLSLPFNVEGGSHA